MVEFGRDLLRLFSPNPLLRSRSAQVYVCLGFDYVWASRLYSVSKQSLSKFDHAHSKNSALLCSEVISFFSKFGHFLLFCNRLTEKTVGLSLFSPISKIFLCFLFSRLNIPSTHILSSYDRFYSSLIMALC